MNALMDLLKRYFTGLYRHLSSPPRHICPHCGGGRCYGACQMDLERTKRSTSTESSRKDKRPS